MSVYGGKLIASTARSSGIASRKARSMPFFTCKEATSRLAPGRVSHTFSWTTPSSSPTSSVDAPERSRYGAISARRAATRDFRSAIVGRIRSMCFPPGARPPDLPPDLRAISGGAGGEEAILRSADGASFRAFVAQAQQGDAGVVIAPDVRGLHSFYEDL